MNISKSLTALISLALLFHIQSCSNPAGEDKNHEAETTLPDQRDELLRGKYLVEIMGCNDCHSPKRMGAQGPEIIPELMLSGYPADRPMVDFTSPMIKEGFAQFYPDLTAAAGPWGITFAGNLTPHETGLGNWTEAQFKKALTEGKYKGLDNTRPLLPPMPWQNYINMTDQDIHAIFSYLQSIPAVDNTVPAVIAP